MGKIVLTDTRIYVGKLDLSGSANEGEMSLSAEAVECTNFDSANFRERLPGLMEFSVTVAGYFDDTEAVHDDLFSKIGFQDEPFSIVPTDGLGNVGFFGDGVPTTYTPIQGAVGEALKFNLDMEGAGSNAQSVIRGLYEHYVAGESSAGSSTGRQYGQVSATQRLYAVVHLIELTGTNIDFIVEGDTVGFPSVTTKLTFPSMTTETSNIQKSAVGADTDDYYRLTWTGTFTTATFAALIGIK